MSKPNVLPMAIMLY